MDFSWSADYPDLNKQCKLFHMVELLNPKRFKYKPLGICLQNGPQCGIVALTLFTDNVSQEKADLIHCEGIQRNYSYNGEMFSCYNMCELAKDFTSYQTKVYEGVLDCDYIKDFLFDGGFLLVPYDSDKNNGPCFNNGLSAHWAAISGIIETEEDFYILAKQGKSKRIGIWKLKDLSDSNAQLNEFLPERKDSMAYRIPKGGIQAGLCKKCVMLYEK